MTDVASLELVRANLLSPMVLAFLLGIGATLVRSDLRIPDDLYSALSIYLLLAIGLKGGAALAATPISEFWAPGLVTVALGVVVPLWCYAALRRLGGFGVPDAAALAAHYGSVSAVTFIASLGFLEALGAKPEGFLPALVALLEVPAIVLALGIARSKTGGGDWGEALREIVTGKSIVLLLGGVSIGLASGPAGIAKVKPFFVDPFQGALCLFLLEMGMTAARRFRDLAKVGAFLGAFAVIAPVVNGALGVAAAHLAGLSAAGATVLGTMASSASYIAAPAAVRVGIPEANPAYYLTASLAITFPFNLTFGIPLYHALAQWMYA
jgi:hypothetical protein